MLLSHESFRDLAEPKCDWFDQEPINSGLTWLDIRSMLKKLGGQDVVWMQQHLQVIFYMFLSSPYPGVLEDYVICFFLSIPGVPGVSISLCCQ